MLRKSQATSTDSETAPPDVRSGEALGRDWEGSRDRGRDGARVDLKHVRAGKAVDVDRAWPDVVAARNLRRAEMAAARPLAPAALRAVADPVRARGAVPWGSGAYFPG